MTHDTTTNDPATGMAARPGTGDAGLTHDTHDTLDTPEAEALDRLLAARHSCRGFTRQQVPRATIRRILEIAQRTASWCNAQPWQLLIASGAAADRFREAIMNAAATQPEQPDFAWPREYRGVYRQRRRECGFQLYDSVGIARGDRQASARQAAENFRLFGAPHVAIVTTAEALGVYGAVDCGAYVANFMLAAQALGVATIAQAALARHSAFVREHFGLGDDRRVVCGISFGYEEPTHPANGYRTSRAPIDEVVRWADG